MQVKQTRGQITTLAICFNDSKTKAQRVLIFNPLVNRPLPIQGSKIQFSLILCCNFWDELRIYYGSNMFSNCNLENLHIVHSFWRIKQNVG